MPESKKDKLIALLQEENTELKEQVVLLKEQVALLKERVEELERRLKMSSENSSKPPSSDPPHLQKKKSSKKKGKKRGGQKGHEPHLKKLLPPEKVTRHVLEPSFCPTCGSVDLTESGEEPLRHQIIDVPPIELDVVEYTRPVRQCKCCSTLVYAKLPGDVPKSSFGPGVLSLIAILTGDLNTSKRKALMMMNEVFNVPMSLGGLSNCEERISKALEAPYKEVLDHIREQEVAHADETSWRRGNGVRGWLWTLCSQTAAAFMIHAKRSQIAAKELLGEFGGVLASDRWSAYNFYDKLRQCCWAHIKRDFKAVGEKTGSLGKIGMELHELAKQILVLRGQVRDGTLEWEAFQEKVPPLRDRVKNLLEQGALYDGKLGGKCRGILKMFQHLWTFIEHQGVEPTNNHAERQIRQGVLWRKGSFGTQSDRGARYVERILTVGATCKLRGRSIVEFLRKLCQAHLQKLPYPSLIT